MNERADAQRVARSLPSSSSSPTAPRARTVRTALAAPLLTASLISSSPCHAIIVVSRAWLCGVVWCECGCVTERRGRRGLGDAKRRDASRRSQAQSHPHPHPHRIPTHLHAHCTPRRAEFRREGGRDRKKRKEERAAQRRDRPSAAHWTKPKHQATSQRHTSLANKQTTSSRHTADACTARTNQIQIMKTKLHDSTHCDLLIDGFGRG